MSRLTTLAMLGAAGISAVALHDAATFALTGENSSAGAWSGLTPLFVIGYAVHVVAYLLFAAVLWVRGPAMDGGSRFRRVVRRVLLVSLGTLALAIGLGTVAAVVTGQMYAAGWYGAVTSGAFVLMFLASVVLGMSLLRRRGLRTAGWLLTAVLPALGLTILLGVLGSPWAHPAYMEVLSAFGLAAVGLAPRRAETPSAVGDVPAEGAGHPVPVSGAI